MRWRVYVALGAAMIAGSLAAVLPSASNADSTVSGAPAGVDGASGIGDPYWPLDGNGGIDVAAYRVHVRYDFATGELKGRTRVKLRATQSLDTFSLDLLLPARRVSVNGVQTPFEHRGHELRIDPGPVLRQDTLHTIVVWYSGLPDEVSYAGSSPWLASAHEVVTMGQPHVAPWWFPANDHPSDRARMDIRVTVDPGVDVVSNGQPSWVRTTRRGQRTHRWVAMRPMVPYLAFFAAGDFEIRHGVHRELPWSLAVSQQLSGVERRSAMQMLRKTPRVVAWLSRQLGKYPFSSTGGMVTSLPVGFALENQTRPIYPAGADLDAFVVHELAHQWFGDSVSVHRWRDIWLNEGFSTFMEWRWTEIRAGYRAEQMLRDTYDTHGPNSRFWKLRIGDPGPAHLLDRRVYDRGAMAVQALRSRIGEADFWRLVRTWLSTRAGGSASIKDFEAMAEEMSGQDLKSFFDVWLRTPAKPAEIPANGLG